MKVAFDFDGIFVKSEKLKSKAIEELFGYKISPENINKNDIVNIRKILSEEEYTLMQKVIYETNYGRYNCELMENSLYYVHEIISLGHYGEIITARGDKGVDIAKKILNDNNYNLPVTGTTQKNKSDYCKDFDYYIDDQLKELVKIRTDLGESVGPKLYLNTWKKTINQPVPDYVTKTTLKGFYEEIKKYS
jgi:hypothetical protein